MNVEFLHVRNACLYWSFAEAPARASQRMRSKKQSLKFSYIVLYILRTVSEFRTGPRIEIEVHHLDVWAKVACRRGQMVASDCRHSNSTERHEHDNRL